MGQTLSAPVTRKRSHSGKDERYYFAASEMQGWRLSYPDFLFQAMEDAHVAILNLDEDKSSDKNAFFAVYDGHGGATVAQFSGQNIHKRLATEEMYYEKRFDVALKKAFLGTDEDMRADPSFFQDHSGCTAVAALLTSDGKLYVANAGDSRSVLSVKGAAKPLSYDHKPQNETESSRIIAAGGYIENNRVNGNLALSRAIGDFEFKKNYSLSPEQQIITANPEVITHEVTDEDEFLVLACDGIWDCLSSQQVVDAVRQMIHDGMELTEICDKLMDICLAPDPDYVGGIGYDNMTVLIVALLNGRTQEEWYAWMKDRVAKKYGYDTPERLPQVYSTFRLGVARGKALDRIDRDFGFGGFLIPRHALDEEESEEEADSGDNLCAFDSFSLRAPAPRDMTISFKAQFEELRAGLDDMEGYAMEARQGDGGSGSGLFEEQEDEDVDVNESDFEEENEMDSGHDIFRPPYSSDKSEADRTCRQGEAPLPPQEVKPEELHQLTPQLPLGNEPRGPVKVEGLMDASESPFKTD